MKLKIAKQLEKEIRNKRSKKREEEHTVTSRKRRRNLSLKILANRRKCNSEGMKNRRIWSYLAGTTTTTTTTPQVDNEATDNAPHLSPKDT